MSPTLDILEQRSEQLGRIKWWRRIPLEKGELVMSGTNFILIVVTILTLLFVLVTVMPLVSSF
jgi:hypothetical protein